MGWPAHSRELIKNVMVAWRAGASYNQMAEQFKLTPSAVAGIVGRNKVTGEVVIQSLQTSDISPVKRLPTSTKWSLLAVHLVRYDTCQWILGEPSADDFSSHNDSCKCGTVTGAGRVYCLEHEIRSVVPLSERHGRRRAVYAKGGR